VLKKLIDLQSDYVKCISTTCNLESQQCSAKIGFNHIFLNVAELLIVNTIADYRKTHKFIDGENGALCIVITLLHVNMKNN
jgi:hypothetical protein